MDASQPQWVCRPCCACLFRGKTPEALDLAKLTEAPCAFCQKVLPGQDLHYVWVPGITNDELADNIILRLNGLVKDPDIREDIHELIEARQPCSTASAGHPTIQTVSDQSEAANPLLGFLGILNGLVGAMPDGPKAGCGYIAAVYDDADELTGFQRVVNDA